MENVTLDVVYKHLLKIERRLDKLEDILEIPETELSAEELSEHKKTLKRMMGGDEGTSWDDYKKGKR